MSSDALAVWVHNVLEHFRPDMLGFEHVGHHDETSKHL